MKTNDIYEQILAKNGWKYQYTVAIEELAELTKELTKAIRDKTSYARICEEIADVEICLAEIKHTIPRSNVQIQMFKEYKLKRLAVLCIEEVKNYEVQKI